MFCKNCGTPLPDGSKYCTTCGYNLEAEAVRPAETPSLEPQVVTPEIPTPEVPTPEAPAPEVFAPEAQPDFAQPWQEEAVAVLPKKKSKKFLAWLIPSVAGVVAASVAVAVFWAPIKGFFLKNFGSSADYRDFVQENTTKTATGTISKAYGAIVNTLSGESMQGGGTGAADLSVKLTVNDQVISLLESLIEEKSGEKIDMDWAKDVELKLSTDAQEELQQIGAVLNIGSEEVAALDCILDADEGMLYVENLKDQFLALDLQEYMYGVDGSATAMMEYLQDPELIAALPTEEEINDLLNKYIGIALSSFEDVEKATETVEVGDVKQKLTVLETKIDGDDLLDAAKAVLEELSKDKQAEKILRRAVEYVEDNEALDLDVDADEVCDAFFDGIDDLLDELDDVDGDDLEVEIVLTQYVNSSHEVVGYALEAFDEEVLHIVEIKDGDKVAFELKVPNSLEIVGEGTEKKGVINADYVISVEAYAYWDEENEEAVYEKRDVLKFSLVDFKVKDNTVNGKIRFALPDETMDELASELELPPVVSSVINVAELALEVSIDTTEKSSAIAFSLLTGETSLATVSLTATEKDASDIELPDEAYGSDDAEYWAEGFEEELLEGLEKAGLPVGKFFYAQKDAVVARPIY